MGGVASKLMNFWPENCFPFLREKLGLPDQQACMSSSGSFPYLVVQATVAMHCSSCIKVYMHTKNSWQSRTKLAT